MIVENLALDTRQRSASGLDLGQDIHAVAALIDHAGYSTHLPLDAPKARELTLVIGVAALVSRNGLSIVPIQSRYSNCFHLATYPPPVYGMSLFHHYEVYDDYIDVDSCGRHNVGLHRRRACADGSHAGWRPDVGNGHASRTASQAGEGYDAGYARNGKAGGADTLAGCGQGTR